jgi:bifunctional non-homologous end joining protein LigD
MTQASYHTGKRRLTADGFVPQLSVPMPSRVRTTPGQEVGRAQPPTRTNGLECFAVVAGLPDQSPCFVPPMQCKLVDCLPVGSQWRYELKLDGYRTLAIKTAAGTRLISRNQKDLSQQFPEIVAAVAKLNVQEAVIDGEIVAVDKTGKPSFQALQHAGRPRTGGRPILYFAFDLLNLTGKAITSLPLTHRKDLLSQILAGAPDRMRFCGFLEGDPDAILKAIRHDNLEGIVAKLASSRYEPDKRSGAWVKFKCGFTEEFVIGGYTLGHGGRTGFGALIVGYYRDDKLFYASKVGSGFSNLQIRQLVERAASLRQALSPFERIPESDGSSWAYGLTAAERRTAVWLKPTLVCRVRFTEWTRDGHLRHPIFEGMRDDKDVREVVRESGPF